MLASCKEAAQQEYFKKSKENLSTDEKKLFEGPTGGDTLPSSSTISSFLDKRLQSPGSDCTDPPLPPKYVTEDYSLKDEKADYIDLPVGEGLVDHINKFFRDRFGEYQGGELTFGSTNDNAFHGAIEKLKLMDTGDDVGKTFGLFIEHVRNYKKDEKESQLAVKFYTDLYTKLEQVKDGPYSKAKSRDDSGAYYQSAKSVEGADFDIVKGIDGNSYMRIKVGFGVERHAKRGYAAQIQETYHDFLKARRYNNQESEEDKVFANTRLGYGRIIRWTNNPEGPLTKVEGGLNLDTIKDQNYGYVRVINEVPVGKRLKLVTDATVRTNQHVTVGGRVQLQATKNVALYAGVEREIGDKRIANSSGSDTVYSLGATYSFGGIDDKVKMKYKDAKKYKLIQERVLRSKDPVKVSKDRKTKTAYYEVNVYVCELASKKVVEVINNATSSSSEMPIDFDHTENPLIPADAKLDRASNGCQ